MADAETSARLAFEVALWRLQQQIEYGRSLDSKLGSAFALSAAMIALLGSALIFASPLDERGVGAAVTAAAALFIANIVISTAALLIWRLNIGPTSMQLRNVAVVSDDEDVWRLTAEQFGVAERGNVRVLRIKAVLVGAALLVTAATAIAVATAAILAV